MVLMQGKRGVVWHKGNPSCESFVVDFKCWIFLKKRKKLSPNISDPNTDHGHVSTFCLVNNLKWLVHNNSL